MVQILNKMVHLQYPILEIWCFEEEVYKSPSDRIVPDLQLTGSHTRTKREPIKKKQFSPEQKGV